jgi:hypothetical protein
LSAETPEQTYQRLYQLAEMELAEAMETGAIDATAVDGSLASGRTWPSSDLDVTVVPHAGPDWDVEWRIRSGIVVHKHVNGWPLLERLQRGFPESFIDTAAGEWIRDPTWLLDGLASLKPVHDPESRLLAASTFIREHRFDPEVSRPRQPLLMARACQLTRQAEHDYGTGDTAAAARHVELATEALALIWLEAAHRMISLKEMDPELAAACTELGVPEAHTLFRAAVGVAHLDNHAPEIGRAFRRLLDVYSRWLDEVLSRYPSGREALDRKITHLVYHRHRLWSGMYAPSRGCYLHLAAVRIDLSIADDSALREFAREWYPNMSPSRQLNAITRDRNEVLRVFPLDPWKPRLAALQALLQISRKRFSLDRLEGLEA